VPDHCGKTRNVRKLGMTQEWTELRQRHQQNKQYITVYIVAYALRLNSRAGTEGSTVSSLNCDCWLIMGFRDAQSLVPA